LKVVSDPNLSANVYQEFMDMTSAKIYTRSLVSGTWSQWKYRDLDTLTIANVAAVGDLDDTTGDPDKFAKITNVWGVKHLIENAAGSLAGGLFQFDYKIKTDASSTTPAAKHISFDDVDFTKTTKLYINKKDRTNTDMSLFLNSIVAGDWFNIHDNNDINDFVAFDITGPAVVAGDVFVVPVSHYGGNGTLKNDERVYIHWQQVDTTSDTTVITDVADIVDGGNYEGTNIANSPV